jgi:preprotein translocase subunit SecE
LAVHTRHLQPARFDGFPARPFEIPEQASLSFWAHPSGEGWAASACSDSLIFTVNSSGNGRGTSMAISPFKFLQEVRSETAKVTWPTRRETTITTIMVFVMVALASIFFFAADQIIRFLITMILGIH